MLPFRQQFRKTKNGFQSVHQDFARYEVEDTNRTGSKCLFMKIDSFRHACSPTDSLNCRSVKPFVSMISLIERILPLVQGCFMWRDFQILNEKCNKYNIRSNNEEGKLLVSSALQLEVSTTLERITSTLKYQQLLKGLSRH